ncbi:hypothetical protein [Sphingobacterium kyonggiense]
MNDLNKEYIKVDKGIIKGFFKVFFFRENGSFLFYVPSLNLSSYGDSVIEAEDMMKNIVIPDYCRNLMSLPKSTIFHELKQLGWQRSKFFQNDLTKELLVNKQDILKEFDLSDDTIIEEKQFTIAC